MSSPPQTIEGMEHRFYAEIATDNTTQNQERKDTQRTTQHRTTNVKTHNRTTQHRTKNVKTHNRTTQHRTKNVKTHNRTTQTT